MLHWQYFCGALGDEDDITLLAPILSSFKYMLNICHQFNEAYEDMFNLSKNNLLFFGRSESRSCVHILHVNLMVLLLNWLSMINILAMSVDKIVLCVRYKIV